MTFPLTHRLVLALALVTACEAKKGDPAKADVNTDAKTAKADVKANAKTADAKTADASTDTKVGEVEGKAGGLEGKVGLVDGKVPDDLGKAPEADAEAPEDPVRLGDPAYEVVTGKPVAAAPVTVEEAAEQLEAWLEEPAPSPVPALLLATGKIEIAIHCGPCTDDRAPEMHEPASTLELGKLLRSIIGEGEGWVSGGPHECDERCCSFGPYTSEGSGCTSLDKVCMTVGADGKPTAYTRIDGSHH